MTTSTFASTTKRLVAMWHDIRQSIDESLNTLFGIHREQPLDWPFSERSIAQLRLAKNSTSPQVIDDQTWADLGLSAYRDFLSAETSIFGKQMLYYQLRSADDAVARHVRIKRLTNHPQRHALKEALKPLRELDTEIVDLLYLREPAPEPTWASHLWILPYLIALSFAAIFLSLFAIAALVVLVAVVIGVQNYFSERIEVWQLEAKSLRCLLGVATALGKLADQIEGNVSDGFPACAREAGKTNRAITQLPFALLPGFKEYADWYMLSNIRHYQQCQKQILRRRIFLQTCFEEIASLEADLSVALHLTQATQKCWSNNTSSKQFSLDDVVHPLLANAKPLSISLNKKGALITGANGIGKSTLLKTIGINLIAGRAFGFCYAREATVTTLPLYASFNYEDSIIKGESLYIAELRRAHELLAASATHGQIVCLIDEIFRGTNHLESVAAASAILHALVKQYHALVIVSSHHVVLAPLLADCLTPVYLSIKNGNIASLQLKQGVLTKTNGVALLSERGFSDQVVNNANGVLDWLNGYLAYPTVTPGMLRD